MPPDASSTTRRSDSAIASPSSCPSSRKSSVWPHWLMPMDAHALAAVQVGPDVDRAVEDRQVRVVAAEDPRVVAARRLLLQRRAPARGRRACRTGLPAMPRGSSLDVKWPLRRSADVMMCSNVDLPVRVEHDDGVGLQAVEHLGPQPLQAGNEADLLPVVISRRTSSGSMMVGTWATSPAPTISPMWRSPSARSARGCQGAVHTFLTSA